jgi:hypothetical protein
VTQNTNSLDKELWWLVCREVRPDIERPEYEAQWLEWLAWQQEPANDRHAAGAA